MGKEIDDERNGRDNTCPFHGHVREREIVGTVEKVIETHTLLASLIEHTECLPAIAKSNGEIRDYLMLAATGGDHIPVKIVEKLVKIGGLVIFGLTAAIVFILTGQKFGWIGTLH